MLVTVGFRCGEETEVLNIIKTHQCVVYKVLFEEESGDVRYCYYCILFKNNLNLKYILLHFNTLKIQIR